MDRFINDKFFLPLMLTYSVIWCCASIETELKLYISTTTDGKTTDLDKTYTRISQKRLTDN